MHWTSILSYMASSFMIVVFNKIVLTIFSFNSIPFILFCQSLFTMVVLLARRSVIQRPSVSILWICILNILNIYCGISAASALNVAMFSALRRISIFTTLCGQWYFLHTKPTKSVVFSVLCMILGAIVAASNDLSFNVNGYIFVMLNNCFTSGVQIETKRAIENDWTKTSILFWSATLSTTLFGLQLVNFNPNSFDSWDNKAFQIAFLSSMCLGFVINWSASWTIEKNDALTLAVAGSTKSAIMGLFVVAGLFDPTYSFTWVNFIGLQISAIASLFYVYAVSVVKEPPKVEIDLES